MSYQIQITSRSSEGLGTQGKNKKSLALEVGRYTKSALQRRIQFKNAKEIWESAAVEILCA